MTGRHTGRAPIWGNTSVRPIGAGPYTDAEGNSIFEEPSCEGGHLSRARAGTYADASKRTCPRTGQMLDINSVKKREIYLFIRV